MKVNKKLVVIFLSALIGLSVSGGIGGAFAWYQYNSQVTASFIGSSVADTSVLQIGHLNSNSQMVWERDFVHQKQTLIPVTFGALVTSTSTNKANCLAEHAYGYPEAGKQAYDNYSSWTVIEPNKGFAQFDIYLRAFNANKAAIARDVYLSDITIDSPAEANNSGKLVSEAIRIHLAVEGNVDPNRLISKTAISSESPLNLYGPLDLDADGNNDIVGGYAFNQDRTEEIIYGINGQKQVTTGATALKQGRDPTTGAMPVNNPDGKRICTTKADSTQFTKVTVTVWIEGWAFLADANDNTSTSRVWDPTLSAGFDVNVGMTFDTGKMIGNSSSSSSSSSSEESSSSSESTESV